MFFLSKNLTRRANKMAKYRVKVDVLIEEVVDGESSIDNLDRASGRLLAEKDAESIDKVERVVMERSYAEIRRALGEHFSFISKKKPSR